MVSVGEVKDFSVAQLPDILPLVKTSLFPKDLEDLFKK
jgi:hypothetical protein